MSQPQALPHLVVIGSSAGGIDALSTLVSTLPTDFAAPIVIAQHLDPSRQSHLGDILERRSALPVRTVIDQEPIERGVIYVVPSNRHVHIDDHHIDLREASGAGPRPSVDLLLSSAAQAYGDRLIAVILSGTGSDGAAGARIVKKAGGTVVIQDPNTAAYPGMPLSLAPTTVDIVANVERIGPLLHDLLSGEAVPARPNERRALEAFLDEVRERHGLDFNQYKTPTILRRLQRRFVATDTDNLEGYITYLHSHPEEYQQLVNTFLIKVTEFFRDPELFSYLRDVVIPDLVTQARKRGSELRIWSAGCATGEEAYSLAILLCEALGPALDHFTVRIFATDADAGAIAFARRGVYPASALADVPEQLVTRYFARDEEGNYQVRKRVRSLAVFGQHDLGGRAPFPNIDLVLCRNVLIYFTPELQQRTLRLFAYSLRHGGYLALGKAETPGQLADFFTVADKQHRVYRREGDRILMPLASFVSAPAQPQQVERQHRLMPTTPAVRDSLRGLRDVQRVRHPGESMLHQVPVGIIVVNAHYDIQSINAAARRLLSIHGTAIGEDVVHIAPEGIHSTLRAAIDSALRNGTPAEIQEVGVEATTTREPYYLHITSLPQHTETELSRADSVLLVIQDITQHVRTRRELEMQIQATSAEVARERRDAQTEATEQEEMLRRLVETNRQLIEANEELTTTNEELRTTSEEFLLSTEEAQAAIEEVETLNEELQATNEELETLNEELQSTIEELNTTNDDLHARSVELMELARVSEDERTRLQTILSSMADAVLVVNDGDQVLLSNAAYDRLAEQFSARELRDANDELIPSEETPRRRAARGESFSMEFTLTETNGGRRWYEASGQPVRSGQNNQREGVVVIRDITERSLRRMQAEFVTAASHELRTPLTSIQSYLQMLVHLFEHEPVDTPARRYAHAGHTQAKRLARLVNDLVDVRRLQTGKLTIVREPVRIDDVVRGSVETAQALTTTQTIHLDMEDAPIVVIGDADRLHQVMLNLLSNAITYAPQTERIDVRLRRDGDTAVIQVQDYGPGIAAKDLPHLFSQFYQASEEGAASHQGLGLGLYILHEIVQAHGGQVSVESVEGKGTTFTVRLPLAGE